MALHFSKHLKGAICKTRPELKGARWKNWAADHQNNGLVLICLSVVVFILTVSSVSSEANGRSEVLKP